MQSFTYAIPDNYTFCLSSCILFSLCTHTDSWEELHSTFSQFFHFLLSDVFYLSVFSILHSLHHLHLNKHCLFFQKDVENKPSPEFAPWPGSITIPECLSHVTHAVHRSLRLISAFACGAVLKPWCPQGPRIYEESKMCLLRERLNKLMKSKVKQFIINIKFLFCEIHGLKSIFKLRGFEIETLQRMTTLN